MSTKTAPWPKWPSKWLKTLPKLSEGHPESDKKEGETGSFAEEAKSTEMALKRPSKGFSVLSGFLEQPLRYPTQRPGAKKTPPQGNGHEKGTDECNDWQWRCV